MNENFSPLFQGKKIIPRYPSEEMPKDIKDLWEFFSKELKWGGSIEARATFEFLINARKFCTGRVILDAGAGHQRYKPFFDTSIYLSQEHPSGIEFKKMQGIEYDLISPLDELIPLQNDSIAGAICTSVVEHVRYPEKFFAESHRILQPGGRFYIHVPFTYHEHEAPYDFQRPTSYGLRAWLQSAGFKKISISPASNSFTGSSSFIMTFLVKELSERGQHQKLKDLAPIVKYCIDMINESVDDYINADADFPIGWIAIAEKDGVLPEEHFSKKSDIFSKILTVHTE